MDCESVACPLSGSHLAALVFVYIDAFHNVQDTLYKWLLSGSASEEEKEASNKCLGAEVFIQVAPPTANAALINAAHIAG